MVGMEFTCILLTNTFLVGRYWDFKGLQDTDCIENSVEKGEIAHFEQFHLFPQCFPEAFYINVLKRVYIEGRVE